ncbi:MAG: K(+)-transporting ATPase subunit F [Bacteroidota bacterium]|nr:K(+)-transporting ATPase subunit F [Bacteroidota bacterium]
MIITVFVPTLDETTIGNGMLGYLLGALIALFIMGYLVYSLLKPEKF